MMYTTRTTENESASTMAEISKRYMDNVVSAVNADIAKTIIAMIPSFDNWVRDLDSFKALEVYDEVKYCNVNDIEDTIHSIEKKAFEYIIEGLEYSPEEAKADMSKCTALREAVKLLNDSKATYSTACNKIHDISNFVMRGDLNAAERTLCIMNVPGFNLDAIGAEIASARREHIRAEETMRAFGELKPYAVNEVKSSVDDVLTERKTARVQKLNEDFTNTCACIGLGSVCVGALKVAVKVATKLIK